MWTILTVLIYFFLVQLNKRWKIPFFNSVLYSSGILIGIILIFGIDYESYRVSANPITASLGPLVILLAVPIYKNKRVLMRYFKQILFGIFISGSVSTITIIALSKLLKLDQTLMVALIPKSITTPMAVALTEILGGIPGITVVAVTITGLFGGAIFPLIMRMLKLKNPLAIGVSLGAAAHAIGTGKALEISEEAGAYSGIAMGVTGLIYVLCGSIFSLFII